MRTFLRWTREHWWLYWGSAVLLSAALIATEVLFGSPHFFLVPYPTWNPTTWIPPLATFCWGFPWLAAGLLGVPVAAMAIWAAARWSKASGVPPGD